MITPEIRVAALDHGAVKVFITWPGEPLATTVLHGPPYEMDHLGVTPAGKIPADATAYLHPAHLERPGEAVEADMTAPPASEDALTERQVEILGLIAQGLTDRAIAQRVYVTEHTASTHVRRTLRKLGARNRAHAVHLAHQGGLLPVPHDHTMKETSR